MNHRLVDLITLTALTFFSVATAGAATPSPARATAIRNLELEAAGKIEVLSNRATGVARVVRLEPGALKLGSGSIEEQVRQLFAGHGSAFDYNRYNLPLYSSGDGNSNPLAGEWTFSGTDEGGFDGTWGQSQVNLLQVAEPGDQVRIRFDFGVDECIGNDGWYLDAVLVVARVPGPRRGGGRQGG